jgi:hypothetical protein
MKKLILAVAVLAATLSLTAVLAGCAGTVAPKVVASSQASWDGTNQNSGSIDWAPGKRLIITAHARDRYNALIASYGSRFKPALVLDQDIEPTGTNTFLLAPAGIEHFSAMVRWDKQTRKLH